MKEAITEVEALDILTDMIEVGINPALRRAGRNVGEFFKFIGRRADLMQLYIANQQTRAEVLGDEIVDIADNEFDVERARARIGARQWFASRILPRKYGDKLNVEVKQVVDMRAAIEEGKRRAMAVIATPVEQKPEVAVLVPEIEYSPHGEASTGDLEAWAENLVSRLPIEARPRKIDTSDDGADN